MRPLVAHCHLGLGKLSRRTGDGANAQRYLQTARAMYREMGMPFWVATVDAALADTDRVESAWKFRLVVPGMPAGSPRRKVPGRAVRFVPDIHVRPARQDGRLRDAVRSRAGSPGYAPATRCAGHLRSCLMSTRMVSTMMISKRIQKSQAPNYRKHEAETCGRGASWGMRFRVCEADCLGSCASYRIHGRWSSSSGS